VRCTSSTVVCAIFVENLHASQLHWMTAYLKSLQWMNAPILLTLLPQIYSTLIHLSPSQAQSAQSTQDSPHKKLLEQFNAIIKGQQERGVSATVGRSLRWQPGRNPVAASTQSPSHLPQLVSGNALNAAEVASNQAKQLLTKRTNAFRKYKLPTELETARVSVITPLQVGDTGSGFGFVVLDGSIMLGQVLSIYSKSGGKNGKHGWVPNASCVSAISYAPMQVFEHMFNQQFRAIPRATHCLQLSKFVLLPSSSFLCTLDRAPRTLLTNLEISSTDYQRFLILRRQVQNIVSALKSLNGRKRKEAPEEDEELDD